MQNNISDVIENIRTLRGKRKFSQEYMGASLGVGQNAYSKLELGYTKITVNQFLIIAGILDIDPVVLISGKPVKKKDR